ncbi:hypothetical protein T440DRAFT_456651 [Plenodomus tracheiphilus IPT5]|uniref:Uncharacterized protein n=1 Tax=Plenodomus tracheiphilus IPT5 TaxID=1408161 RepID=A0A6A7AW09_9PLEO|nr:hypothetical protein T440DRAFT_456651 [Plenodomus tracheiphilus IPT5]
MQTVSPPHRGATQYRALKPESEVTAESNSGKFPKGYRGETIAGWPKSPKTLQDTTPSYLTRMLPHVLLLLVPLAAIGLGIAVLRVNGGAESTTGNAVTQAMRVTATLWPILFAAVLGPTLKAVMLYYAQRGTKLGLLEILATSQTLVSTLRGLYTVRIISFWPILLVVVWILSPAGGQGALRALVLKDNITTLDYPLIVYPINNLSIFEASSFNSGASGGASLMSQFRASVGAVFATPDIVLLHANQSSREFEKAVQRVGGVDGALKMTQSDLWRNVRIPFLHTLPTFTAGSVDWTHVSSTIIPRYSSLIGVPIRGYPQMHTGNTSLSIQTNYQTLECGPWVASEEWRLNHNGSLVMKDSFPPNGVAGLPNIHVDIVTDEERFYVPGPLATANSWPRKRMTLALWTMRNLTLCEVGTEYVESLIDCNRAATNSELDCHVSKMRALPLADSYFENYTALDVVRNFNVLSYVPYTLASNHPLEPSVLESWLKNPALVYQGNVYSESRFWYEDIPLDVFSDRLAMVLNTYIRATINMTNTFGSDGISLEGRDDTWANSTGTWTQFTAPVYHIEWAWFLLYAVSALVLALCGFANVLLRSFVHIPDFLGSISALTRDSRFIEVPTPGSGMDGAERARLLRDKWVMVQDVNPEEEDGRIAFSDAQAGVPLQKSRNYV